MRCPRRVSVLIALPIFFGAIVLLSAAPATAQQQDPTFFTFPWDWHITVLPNQNPTGDPDFGEPIEIWLWGEATVRFDRPQLVGGDTGVPDTFDLGPGGVGFDTPSAEPPPLGGLYTIPIEIVELQLVSMGPVDFPGGTTDVVLRQSTANPSTGAITNLRNLGDGTVAADSFFDIWVDVELPQLGMSLSSDLPMTAGMSFTNDPSGSLFPPAPPVPELDVPWIPTWIWREIFVNEDAPNWVDDLGLPWDRWVIIHGHVTIPEPSTAGLVAMLALAGGIAPLRRKRIR